MVATGHGPFQYLGVPPDSTGKSLGLILTKTVGYTNGTVDFNSGDTILCSTSGVTGTVQRVSGTTSSGTLEITLQDESPVGLTDGEDITVSAIKRAEVNTATSEDVYFQRMVVAGGNDPHHVQFVDKDGASYVRYSEGEQQLDAFGISRQSSPTTLFRYSFLYDSTEQNDMYAWFDGTAEGVHISDEAAYALDVDTGSGDMGILSSNRYHPYTIGYGQLISMSIASGDSGKTNVRRRWGYFDGYDGLFFEQDGTTLSVVLRSSTAGSVVEERIAQADWSLDRLDGTGGIHNSSQETLAVENLNIYWIDFQWLGAGKIRMGVYGPDGSRITAHEFRKANSSPRPFMRRSNLPIRMEIENTGSTGSPSRLKLAAATAQTDGEPPRDVELAKRQFGSTVVIQSTLQDGYYAPLDGYWINDTPILSFRSTKTILDAEGNPIVNRLNTIPYILYITVLDNPCLIRVRKNAVTDSSTYVLAPSGALEFSTDATVIASPGTVIGASQFPIGTSREELNNIFASRGECLHLRADGEHGLSYTVSGCCLTPGETSTILFTSNWYDLE